MKKYMKNKDFIPEKFCEKIELNKTKSENKILILFLLINLFLIPATVKDIIGIKDKKVETKQENDVKQNKMLLNDISVWVENVLNDDVEEAYITNNNGEIVVNDLNKIDELSSSNFIKVNNVNLNDDKKYKLGVSLYE